MIDILLARIEELENSLVEAHARIARAEGRLERMFRFGKATDVDGQKMRIRMEIAPQGDDGQPVKSDYIPYLQIAGDRKTHSMPSQGQQLVMISPDGDFQQAFCAPLFWSDDHPSPSNDPKTHIDQIGKTKNTQTDGTWVQETNGAKIDMSANKMVHSTGGTSVTLESGHLTIRSTLVDINPA